ncbi:MAG: Mrr restriction system protein [Pseudomonadota bacterium]|jgi:hypothetical protein
MHLGEELLVAAAEHIKNLQCIAKEAEHIAQSEDSWDDGSSALLNFPWLSHKFELFWFENPEIERLLQPRLPADAFFSPLDFEKLVQSVLLLTQDRFYRATPLTGDGGIDLIHQECIDSNWNAFATTLVQCKLYRGHVPISEVRDFFGAISAHTASGIFITTGKFTTQARSFLPLANNSPHSNSLHALDGQNWRTLMAIAKECYAVLEECTQQTGEIQEHSRELELLRKTANELITIQGKLVSQPSLF